MSKWILKAFSDKFQVLLWMEFFLFKPPPTTSRNNLSPTAKCHPGSALLSKWATSCAMYNSSIQHTNDCREHTNDVPHPDVSHLLGGTHPYKASIPEHAVIPKLHFLNVSTAAEISQLSTWQWHSLKAVGVKYSSVFPLKIANEWSVFRFTAA